MICLKIGQMSKCRTRQLVKLLIMLKFILILTTLCCLKGVARSYGQTVSLPRTQAPLTAVLKEICRQVNMDYAFSESAATLAKNTVVIEFSGTPFNESLNRLFQHTGLTYTLLGRVVLVTKGRRRPSTPILPQIQISVSGRVTDSTGMSLAGVSVQVKGSEKGTVTDATGSFSLNNIEETAIIRFSYIGYLPVEVPAKQIAEKSTIQLKLDLASMTDVIISYNTGYQNIPKERATGSFVTIDNETFNRRLSTNILDRLEGITSGVQFTRNKSAQANQADISIRGRSTIFANPNPLIVLDNFPFDGDLNAINPNDVESITILKDAAAASIWGAYSGNGVIVITTKQGKANKTPKISFNTNITVGEKPDLFYQQRLSASDYINAETFLFHNNFYNSFLTNLSRPYLSPVVELLFKERSGSISESEAKAAIDEYRKQDIRSDQLRYAYKNTINQQYAININGGGVRNTYFASVGFDRNTGNTLNSGLDRLTITSGSSIGLIEKKLDLFTTVRFSNTTQKNIGSLSSSLNQSAIPYQRLVSDEGKATPTQTQYRSLYLDTAGANRLLDWNFRYLDELALADNKTIATDFRVNTELRYKIGYGLIARGLFQFSKAVADDRNYFSPETFYARDLINKFTQINPTTGAITRQVPLGGILDSKKGQTKSTFWRGQLDYDNTFNNDHHLTAIAGIEQRATRIEKAPDQRLYGYNPALETFTPVDMLNNYPLYYNPNSTQRIPGNQSFGSIRTTTIDNNFSYFVNSGYDYKRKYLLSVSARRDESNLFGVNTNQKGVPLWSAGGGWVMSQESFYKWTTVPLIKFRATYGANGNVDKSTSALVTSRVIPQNNTFNAPMQTIENPPNPELRWEKISIANIGIDFALKNQRISGTIEYYKKTGKDMIGLSPLAPSTGLTQFKGNTADIKGYGWDFTINTINTRNNLFWTTTALFNIAKDKVTAYKVKTTNLFTQSINPVEGYPVYSLFSYRWAGLDMNGNPQGIDPSKNEPSTNYTTILPITVVGETVNYSGPTAPQYFGNLLNTFRWKRLECSFNITGKFGYFFRQQMFSPFSGFAAYPNLGNRWQVAGDENNTNIPSLLYPSNSSRNTFYEYSELFVLKGDHVRLQDVRLSYQLPVRIGKTVRTTANLYGYINNIGLLWRANDEGIDPDYINGFPTPRTYAAGCTINL